MTGAAGHSRGLEDEKYPQVKKDLVCRMSEEMKRNITMKNTHSMSGRWEGYAERCGAVSA